MTSISLNLSELKTSQGTPLLQLETVAEWAKSAKPLFEHHWRELGLDQDLRIDPNIEAMKALEAAGRWKVFTARDGRELVGYILVLLHPHLHYQSSAPMAIVDAHYVKPEYRNGTGARLFKFMEGAVKMMGAIKIYTSCKVHQDHSRLFKRMGYSLSDYTFIKRI